MNGYKIVLLKAILCFIGCRKVNGYAPEYVRIILFHNHPSGNCKPSKADDELTKNITQLSSLAGVDFIDHLIVSDDDYYSYSNECRYDVLKPQSMMNNLSPFLEKEEIILPNTL